MQDNIDIDDKHTSINIIMLHVDITFLACRGQKYFTMNISQFIAKYNDEAIKNIKRFKKDQFVALNDVFSR